MRSWLCLACGGRKEKYHYLCIPCWRKLDPIARERLGLRDSRAAWRLKQLLKEIKRGTPLNEIDIAY